CLLVSRCPFHAFMFFASRSFSSFFFNHSAPPELYTLSLHDALPISPGAARRAGRRRRARGRSHGHRESPSGRSSGSGPRGAARRSEEHTSELQSRRDLVCRLLLEKKKKEAERAGCRRHGRIPRL